MQTPGGAGAGAGAGAGGTLPPWLSPWLAGAVGAPYAELRRRQLERERGRYSAHMQPAGRLTFYAYGPYGRNPQPVFRIGGFPDMTGGRAAFPRYTLHQLDPLLGIPAGVNVQWMEASSAPGAHEVPRAGEHGGGSGGATLAGLSPRAALRAWLFGSALVVLVVVLIRAIDKCLNLNLLKSRRRSQEWPTPSVRATSHQATDSSVVMIPEEEMSSSECRPAEYSEVFSVDLPPPYSECLRDEQIPDPGGPKGDYEEPPPDYNDTYVEFSNKHGVPSVVIYSRRRPPLGNRQNVATSNDNEASEQQHAQNNGEANAQANTSVTNEFVAHNNVGPSVNFDMRVIRFGMRDPPPGEATSQIEENNIQQATDDAATTTEESNGERIIMV